VRRLDQLMGTVLAGTEYAANPAFSPDGTHIAFIATEPTRALKVVAVTGGEVRMVTDSLVDIMGVSWGYDGYIYFDGKLKGDGLARVRETGGTPEVASTPNAAEHEAYHVAPTALPNGKGVLFTTYPVGTVAEAEVAVLDARTRAHTRLVKGLMGWYAPSGHLLYVTANGTLMAAPFDQERLRLTGPGVAVLEGVSCSEQGRCDLQVTSDGSLLYVAGPSVRERAEFVWVTADGAITRVDSTFAGILEGAALSPDGRRIAASMSTGSEPAAIWVKSVAEPGGAKVADEGFTPSWSPDGKWVLFVARNAFRRVPADGGAAPTTLRDFKSTPVFPQYTPDGRWIVYQLDYKLYATSTTDTTTLALDTGPDGAFPVISPDGRWLAYSSQTGGKWQVFVSPFPDVKQFRRLVSTGDGILPRWSRDGRTLYYISQLTGFEMGVLVSPGATFTASAPVQVSTVRLLTGGIPVTGPDGKPRWLAGRVVGNNRPRDDQLVYIQHFTDELRAKLRAK